MFEFVPIFAFGLTTAAIVGGVALAAGAASSVAGAVGQRKAAKAAEKALASVEGVNIEAVSKAALQADREKFENQFKIQQEIDPTFGRLREQGAQNLLSQITQDSANLDALETQLVDEALLTEPERQQRTNLVRELFSQAEADLQAGATLPPEFQAELVRSGLEAGGTSGTGATGRGASGVGIRTLLGQAGLELKAARQNQAANLLNAADTIKNNRAAILSGVLTEVQNRDLADANVDITALGLGSQAVPQAGLSGTDIANLALTNTQIQNQKKIGLGNVKAQEAQIVPNLIGGLAGAVQSGVSAGLGATALIPRSPSIPTAPQTLLTNPQTNPNFIGRR